MTATSAVQVLRSVFSLYQSRERRQRRRLLNEGHPKAPRSVDVLEDRTMLSAIHGQKYDDLNGNGVHDSGEPGLNDWTIFVFDSSGRLVTTQATQDMDLNNDNMIDPETERGLYWINDLPDGTYTVGEELKPHWVQTDPLPVGTAVIDSGFDLWTTDPDTTWADLDLDGTGGNPPVRVPFIGEPFAAGFADTIVTRKHAVDVSDIGDSQEVDIELVALSLKSVEPIDLDGVFFDIHVFGGSDFNVPQQPGQMWINRDHEFGGTFWAQLPVHAQLFFTEVGNPSNQFQQPFIDVFTSSGVWSTIPVAGDPRLVDPGLREIRPSGGFYPGVERLGNCEGTKVLTQEQALLAAHGVLPAMIEEFVAAGTKTVTITDGIPVLDVKFGNAAKGSIHGYKFHDVNANGIDDDVDGDGIGDEPRLPNVAVTLTGVDGFGRPVGPLTITTDVNGEYWYTELIPGRYTVTETPPAGMYPMTPVKYTVDLLSRQELVALKGQSGIDPGDPTDPRVEIVIGPTLAFGNAFEGSIHGYKFEDLNGNGINDDTDGDGIGDEPRWPGVTMVLTWVDRNGFFHRQTTRTNRAGEYWFSWLEPGLLYNVTEIPPFWSVQTTPDPAPIFLKSGEEWVADPIQAGAVQRAVSFPWWWEVVIDPEPMGGIDPPPETVMLGGMAMIGFSEGTNVQNPTAPRFPLVDAQGNALDLPDGEWLFDTEIISMDLSGHDSQGREVFLTLDESQRSLGQVLAIGNTGANFITGDSFFDVFFEIEIDEPRSDDEMIIRPVGAVNVGMTFTTNNEPPTPQQIPRKDVRWMPAFFWETGLGRDLLDDAGNLWDKLISIHAIPHVEIEKPVIPVIEPTLAFGNAIHGSIHGYKFEDINVNGIDDDFDGDGFGDEPRIPGVLIDLAGDTDGDGNIDYTFVTRTDPFGAYWFTDLRPGVYTVTETPPFGSFPTTPISYTVTLFSGEELVAEKGQAMLGPNDPRVEIVVGPRLAFGNAYEGSIHGYKFEDINGDGIWQRGVEPGLPGVTIELWTVDPVTGQNVFHGSTVTNPFGEYWFAWLEPGLVYDVREIAPPGSVQTTPDPDPIRLLSGQEWVADSDQGRAAQLTFAFPWWWDVVIDPVPDPTTGDDPPAQTLMLEGMAEFRTSELLDPMTRQMVRPLANHLGRANPLRPGDDLLVDIELVSLQLTSAAPVPIGDAIFDVGLTPAAGMRNQGELTVQYKEGIGPDGEDGLLGASFFDVFFDITLTDTTTGETMVLAVADVTDPALRASVQVGMTFTNNNPDPVPVVIPPNDIRWMPTFFWLTGQARELRQVLPDGTLGDLWDELISIHAVPHSEHEKAVRPIIDPDLAFGNTFLGSIHGYKFEDINVNGIDDDVDGDGIGDEPRIPGIPITLTGDTDGDGKVDTVTLRTDVSGEYWFENLFPGEYTVTETPPFGSFPTTPVSFTVTVNSREELVAEPGQAHLPDLIRFPDGDPRVEIVIGPTLAFGNAYEGSIHGYKFHDINGDGIWQRPDEPPLPGVTIVLNGFDPITGDRVYDDFTTTDAKGEYWFTWLEPGLTYQTHEIVPRGMRQTTPDPAPILLQSGEEWVGTVEQGRAAQLTFAFPWWWDIVIDPVPDPRTGNDPPPQTLMMGGMAEIRTSEYLDPATGEVVSPLADDTGRAMAPPAGRDVRVDVELVSLSLTGAAPVQIGRSTFDVFLQLDSAHPTTGMINARLEAGIGPDGEDGIVGDSFFDVFTELVLVDRRTGRQMVLAPSAVGNPTMRGAIQVGMTFGPNNPDPVPTVIPPRDIRWMPTFFWLTDQARELRQVLPNGALGGLWDELISIHAVPHSEHEKPVRPRLEPQLNFGNTFSASIHGRKFHDLNANGKRDPGESYLNGWEIELVDHTGTVVQTTTTMDADLNGDNEIDPETERGWYWLTNVGLGKFSVREVVQAGWRQTNNGTGPAADAYDLDQRLGLYTTGILWENWGGAGEKWLRAANQSEHWYYITPDGSVYRWNNYSGATLGIPLSGLLVATLDPSFHADPSLLHNAMPSKDHQIVVVPGSDRFDDRDFGNIVPNASIHGRKYHDRNTNGMRDPGEEYLNDWTIELLDATGAVIHTTTTMDMDLNGNNEIDPETEVGWYWITGLGLGKFTVREVVPDGWRQTSVGTGPDSLAYMLDQDLGLFTTGNVWTNWGGSGEKWMRAAKQGNQWYYITPDGGVYRWNHRSGAPLGTPLRGTLVGTLSPAFHADPALLYDAQPTRTHSVLVVTGAERFDDRDFGNVQQNSSIHGRKFNDANQNGTRDAGEEYLNGWTIELVDATGMVIQTTTTMDRDLNGDNEIDPETERGWYWLTGIGRGDYSVREVVQAGWIATTPSTSDEILARQLDESLGFFTTGNLHTNYGGLGEKWFRAANDGNSWYYITPAGELYKWVVSTGRPVATNPLRGTLVGTFSSDFHTDPAKIYNAPPIGHQVTLETNDEMIKDLDFGNVLDAAFAGLAESGLGI